MNYYWCPKQGIERQCIKVERKVELCTEGGEWWKTGPEIRGGPNDKFARKNGQSNHKTGNPEELFLFEYVVTEIRTRRNTKYWQEQWYNRNYWRTWQVRSNSGIQTRWCY